MITTRDQQKATKMVMQPTVAAVGTLLAEPADDLRGRGKTGRVPSGRARDGRETPRGTSLGIGYMLMRDKGQSNTDPFATAPTPDNQWVQTPAHVMITVPDVRMLDGITTDPSTGGPYVMWKGTPYAHIMIPVN